VGTAHRRLRTAEGFGSVAALMRRREAIGRQRARGARHAPTAAAACFTALLVAACSDVDPYEVECRELVTSPTRLRETTLKLADQDVNAKVRYERQIQQICANAPEDYRPVPRIKPRG
jgi:hypothetical protein